MKSVDLTNPLPVRLASGGSLPSSHGPLTVITVHANGEVGDVIVGGIPDPPNCNTMFEKMQHFLRHNDWVRNLILQEPRGRPSMCTNIVLPPCDPRADAGFLIMESDEWVPMSGSNTICVTTVLLETGILEMIEPITRVNLDTAAGLVSVVAECKAGKCESVAFDNVPSFVWELDYPVDVPGLGIVKVDVAWGGMIYALVDAESLGLDVSSRNGAKLVEVGNLIRKAAQQQIVPVHPENPEIRGISNFEWMGKLDVVGNEVHALNAVDVLPGRLDRSPCGTGTCARLAVMHAKGLVTVGQIMRHRSPIGTEFESYIRGLTKVGKYDAVAPTVKGNAWITGFKQVVLDPSDPFPEGFRVGDSWHM
jgi:proline racemase